MRYYVLSGMDREAGFPYLNHMNWDDEIDASNLLCPLPVLRARKRLKTMVSGAVLKLIVTDPAAVVDVPHFCAEAGHELLSSNEESGVQFYFIRRG